MPVHPAPKQRRLLAALILATLALALGACGSSRTSGTEADPATAVPASAPLYVGAIVRPEGDLKTQALAAGQALAHQSDPYQRLLGALQTPGSPTLSFTHDVAPWLGAHAGVFLAASGTPAAGSALGAHLDHLLAQLAQSVLAGSSTASAFPFSAHGAEGAIVLDTSDATKARDFLDSQAAHAGAQAKTYRGVAYQATAGGIAFGLVARLAVIGSESALRSVIDTTLGGPSLAHAVGYSRLLAGAPQQALAHLYANGSLAPRTAPAGAHPGGVAALFGLLAGGRMVNVSLVASSTSVDLDVDSLNQPGAGAAGSQGSGLLSSSPEASRAAGELPGESWLAIGLPDVGAELAGDAQGIEGLLSLGSSIAGSSQEGASSGPISVRGLLGAFLAPLGILGADTSEAKRVFQSWMGSAGIFASGSGLLDLKGGLVITSTNPARSSAAVARLGAKLSAIGASVQPVSIPGTDAAIAVRLSGLPVVLDIAAGKAANGQSKFVIALGEGSVAAALSPSSTLSGSPLYATAATALGEGIAPSLVIETPTLLGLLEGVGLSEDPTIAPIVPYLRSLTTVAGGGKKLASGIERFRLVLGLRPSG